MNYYGFVTFDMTRHSRANFQINTHVKLFDVKDYNFVACLL